ncbi:unnamed protein product [Urochloa decumbens]|uniref:chitinase n=1 Tax=Urochloa decumbens TaxID=240449 RepID=A0ABC8WNM5_9POAL
MTKAFAVLVFAGAALLAVAGGASAQQGVWSIITRPMFHRMLSHRGDSGCEGAFYTYDAFIEAASKFPGFGTTGDDETRKRELAAFFGQTSHETTGTRSLLRAYFLFLFFNRAKLRYISILLYLYCDPLCACIYAGGWATAPDGQFAWGYCRIKEQNPTDPPYYGRGPIQLTHDYNYRRAGRALGLDLLGNPDLVSTDPVVAFKTAIWFWMTPQSPKPSCHAVMTGGWAPSAADRAAGRLPGYGLTTNIINGGQECGTGQGTDGAKDRVGYYKRYCDMLRVGYGDNMACKNQKPYGGG